MLNRPLRVTLVDDSDLAAAGFRALLAPFGDRVEVIENRAAIAAPRDLDVVLYEPLGQSSMAASILRDLTTLGEAEAAVYSWAGTDALPAIPTNPYLSKSLTAAQLVVSLEELLEGRLEVAHEVAAPQPAVVESLPTPRRPDTGLTPREDEIVCMIVAGHSNQEISNDLSLSINSVKTYIRSAYRKMGVTRRTQAVLWGLAHGMGAEESPQQAGPLVG